MGKVVVKAKIENIENLYALEKSEIGLDQVRVIDVDNAVVDTGATMLSLPKGLIRQLGLKRLRTRHAKTTAGVQELAIYGTVQLTVQDRDCRVDVAELPEECPPLIGQVPLQLLDFVVDPTGQRLLGNPEHGGEHMIEMY